MDLKPLTAELAVSEQIAPSDVDRIAAQGYRTIICNRPDGEAADQPGFDAIAAAARKAGIEARHIPVAPTGATEADVAAFGDALQSLPQPVLAYCRSGMRSASLWALDTAQSRPLPDILNAARSAGYDLSGLADRIAQNAAAPARHTG